MREDGRENNELRPVEIVRRFIKFAPGSVLISTGDTRVICTAMVQDSVPQFLKDTRRGWVTAEYGMLPGSTPERKQRDRTRGGTEGRTQEIQRLIGRSLRAVIDLSAIGERTIWLDCDVIQADGGTRTASITGAYVALSDALEWLKAQGRIPTVPLLDSVAAVSVGLVNGEPLLDLCYTEDVAADVDMNIVMTGSGRFIEVQGTGEEATFTDEQLQALLGLAKRGVRDLTEAQKRALQEPSTPSEGTAN